MGHKAGRIGYMGCPLCDLATFFAGLYSSIQTKTLRVCLGVAGPAVGHPELFIPVLHRGVAAGSRRDALHVVCSFGKQHLEQSSRRVGRGKRRPAGAGGPHHAYPHSQNSAGHLFAGRSLLFAAYRTCHHPCGVSALRLHALMVHPSLSGFDSAAFAAGGGRRVGLVRVGRHCARPDATGHTRPGVGHVCYTHYLSAGHDFQCLRQKSDHLESADLPG